MSLRALIRLATIATLLLVLGVAALWVFGTAGTFRIARASERVRNSIDAVATINRDVELVQDAFYTVLLSRDSVSFSDYRTRLRDRDTRIRQLTATTDVDSMLAADAATVSKELHLLDAERDALIARSGSAPEPARRLIASDEASDPQRRVNSTLSALESGFRARLAETQPQLERRRDLLLVTIAPALAFVTLLLLWLYREIVRTSDAEAASGARFRRLLDHSPDGILVHAEGLVIYANALAAQMCGATDEQALIGKLAIDLVYPGDRDEIEARTSDVIERGLRPAPRVTRLNRLDGAVIEVETRGGPIDFMGRRAVEVTMRDVADRRRSELALATSEQRFRAVLDTMDEGVCLQDESLSVRLWNPSAERILGLSGDQLSGKTPYDKTWKAVDEFGDDLPGERHFAPIALRTGRPSSGTMGVTRGDGSRVWVQVNAVPMIRAGELTPYAVVVTFTDVTHAREAARRLKDSEARYRLISENSADLITVRASDGRLRYVSPSHTKLLGWLPEELEGTQAIALLHPDDAARMAPAVDEDLFNPVVGGSAVVRLRHRDGHYVWIEVVAAPVPVGDGVVTSYVMSARDISDRLRLEEEVRQAQKMDAMGRMASGIAHDFNNLLTAIRGSAELLTTESSSPGAVAEGAQEIYEAVDRAASLTAQLLAFARRQHNAPTPLDVSRVLNESRGLLNRLAAPRAQLDITVDPAVSDAWILADRSQFEQVLFNLVVNANDAVRHDGHVRIDLAGATLPEAVPGRFGMINAGDYVTMTVSDTGDGIADDVMPHLFEPFFSTKPHGEGTGLGLSTVYGIVRQSQGAVTVSSLAGQGAQFTIYWPRHANGDARPTPAPDVAPSDEKIPPPRVEPRYTLAHEGETLLLVGDELAVRRTVAKLLESHGYRVLQAASGAEAIELLRTLQSSVTAIVTDVRMPIMSGVELVESLHAMNIDLPVLFISGQLDDPIDARWGASHRHGFLRKPFRASELRLRLHDLLRIA